MKIKALCFALLLWGCSNTSISDSFMATPPEINPETQTEKILRTLPAAKRKAVVAVYDFSDQTGQHKQNDKLAEFSRAVTQGGAAILNQALVKAGEGGWFTVIERKGLDNLLKERQIIAATREQYTGKKSKLPPMLYAGVLLEGGIVSYESNTNTGGVGARYLGIGANTQYRQDVVTVYLRAVNVQNGEVLISVNTAKTIYSTAVQSNIFKYVAFDEILELETGFTVNEPPQFAVRQAIESAVYSLVMEGVTKGAWSFENERAGQLALQRYYARLNDESLPDEEDVESIRMVRPSDAIEGRDTGYVPPPSPPVNTPRQPQPQPQAPAPQAQQQRSTTPPPAPDRPFETRQAGAAASIRPYQVPQTATPQRMASPPATPKVNPDRRYQSSGRPPVRRGVAGQPTQLYCTSAGCFPFPPNGRTISSSRATKCTASSTNARTNPPQTATARTCSRSSPSSPTPRSAAAQSIQSGGTT